MKLLNKLGLGLMSLIGASNVAMADVAFDNATKTFSGTFDLTPYYSAVAIIITAVAVVSAIGLAIKMFSRVR
jgi:hypothetical protein